MAVDHLKRHAHYRRRTYPKPHTQTSRMDARYAFGGKTSGKSGVGEVVFKRKAEAKS